MGKKLLLEAWALVRDSKKNNRLMEGKKGGGWSSGLTEGVAPDTAADVKARTESLFGRMLESYRISSTSRLDGLLKLYPELKSLSNAMVEKWAATRQLAVTCAVEYLRDSTNPKKREEFYRHIASTKLPSIDLVLKLRNHLLVKHSIGADDAKDLAKNALTRKSKAPQLDEQALISVTEQLLWDAETLCDIAKKSDKMEKEDWLDYGWMAVRMLDGGQKLMLVEIDALRDVQRECAGCRKPTSKRCARCNAEFYCSTDCQKAQWHNRHKAQCNPQHKIALEELRTILAADFQPIVITAPPKN